MWNSNPSLMRNNLADQAMANRATQATDWALNAAKRPNDPRLSSSTFPSGSWKCNLFVSDQLHAAGIKPPVTDNGKWPITAKMWQGDVQCFEKVTTQQRGDIVSNGEHVGIAVNNTSTVAAGSSKVYMGQELQGGTIQRFAPNDPKCFVKK